MTRLAIVGAGVISSIHAKALRSIPDAQVTWVADQDLSRAEALAAGFGARATASNEEAIATGDVDAVLAAVPTPFHRPVVELAAAAGKHILCEKPIARTVDDAEAMIAAADAAGIRLMIGHVVRFFPEYARIKTALASGDVGQVGIARAARVGPSPSASRSWFGNTALSGGVVVDMMIHDLDTLIWYFGPVERIFANGPGDSYAQATIRFAGGVVAHVEASWLHARFRTTMEIAGEHGILQHDSDLSLPLRLDRIGGDGDSSVERRGVWTERPYLLQLRHFLDRLQDGEPFLTSGREGRTALEAALAILESIRTGQPVHFADGRPAFAGEIAS
jgi:predicted dehydrogenase